MRRGLPTLSGWRIASDSADSMIRMKMEFSRERWLRVIGWLGSEVNRQLTILSNLKLLEFFWICGRRQLGHFY